VGHLLQSSQLVLHEEKAGAGGVAGLKHQQHLALGAPRLRLAEDAIGREGDARHVSQQRLRESGLSSPGHSRHVSQALARQLDDAAMGALPSLGGPLTGPCATPPVVVCFWWVFVVIILVCFGFCAFFRVYVRVCVCVCVRARVLLIFWGVNSPFLGGGISFFERVSKQLSTTF
jgi:hypothetical protein